MLDYRSVDVSCDDFTVRVGVQPVRTEELSSQSFSLHSRMCVDGPTIKIQFLKHERLNWGKTSRAFYQRCCRPVVCFLERISEFQVFARKVCSSIFTHVFQWYVMKYGKHPLRPSCSAVSLLTWSSYFPILLAWCNRLGYLVQAKMVLPSPEELVFDKDVRTFTIIFKD